MTRREDDILKEDCILRNLLIKTPSQLHPNWQVPVFISKNDKIQDKEFTKVKNDPSIELK